MKPVILVLSLASLGLTIALVVVHQQKQGLLEAARFDTLRVSNQWDEARVKLAESEKLASLLQTNLDTRNAALAAVSNELGQARTEAAQTHTELARTRSELQSAQIRAQEQQARIAALEGERDDLSMQMDELNASIGSLESQITATQAKLASAEGDRAFLLRELQRLQDEKAMVLARFNNLAALRAQIVKLKEEAAIQQRLEWIRSGVYSRQYRKGAEALVAKAAVTPLPSPNRLILELERTGAGRVLPATNAPPP